MARAKWKSAIATVSLAPRLTRASQDLFDSDGQVTYPLARSVIDGIADGRRDRHRGEFTKALCAQRACFLVELAYEQDLKLWNVGIGRHQIAGIVSAEIATRRRI